MKKLSTLIILIGFLLMLCSVSALAEAITVAKFINIAISTAMMFVGYRLDPVKED